MESSIRDLQLAELDILRKIIKIIESHNLKYYMLGGTLLGAVRHNGFIPWDDDVDVHMEAHAFRKFLRCYRKHPIPGLHLSWIDTDPEHPYYFAKLRKNGTFMLDNNGLYNKDIDKSNGIWIDIFIFAGTPKNKFLAKVQQRVYYFFATASCVYYRNSIDAQNDSESHYNRRYRTLSGLSRRQMRMLRKTLFFLYCTMGSRRSEYITYTDWSMKPKEKLPRSFELPVIKHKFEDGEFSIPQNYDAALTKQYGNYMEPKQYPSHTDISTIEV